MNITVTAAQKWINSYASMTGVDTSEWTVEVCGQGVRFADVGNPELANRLARFLREQYLVSVHVYEPLRRGFEIIAVPL